MIPGFSMGGIGRAAMAASKISAVRGAMIGMGVGAAYGGFTGSGLGNRMKRAAGFGMTFGLVGGGVGFGVGKMTKPFNRMASTMKRRGGVNVLPTGTKPMITPRSYRPRVRNMVGGVNILPPGTSRMAMGGMFHGLPLR